MALSQVHAHIKIKNRLRQANIINLIYSNINYNTAGLKLYIQNRY